MKIIVLLHNFSIISARRKTILIKGLAIIITVVLQTVIIGHGALQQTPHGFGPIVKLKSVSVSFLIKNPQTNHLSEVLILLRGLNSSFTITSCVWEHSKSNFSRCEKFSCILKFELFSNTHFIEQYQSSFADKM